MTDGVRCHFSQIGLTLFSDVTKRRRKKTRKGWLERVCLKEREEDRKKEIERSTKKVKRERGREREEVFQ